jgi:transportin-3
MDDFVHFFMAYINHAPSIVFSSPALPVAVSHTLAALLCPAPETQLVSLDTLAILSKRLADEVYRPHIQPVFVQYGKAILDLVISGVVAGFPEEGLDQVQQIVGVTVMSCPPQQIEEWVGQTVAGLPDHMIPPANKQLFLEELHE